MLAFNAADTLMTRLRDSVDQRGTLDVLRHGIEMLGLRGKLSLAQFKPALAMNPDILARYAANRLRVVRQVHYSQYNENSIDIVLLLNGLPMATVELKTDFTQSIGDAIDQCKRSMNCILPAVVGSGCFSHPKHPEGSNPNFQP